ncbi:hypothetical protein BLNAU_19918 [Blattamonas nauphoetae]|uniref:Uncharacterized protein n=1 Tax=Blattamonas nauphoetae TaxID=2049346 RepID=A0ABQ9X086_9EUKA|nr:hypothetical protein BLNAU_19918 [Blattamonas nauphoetae]
MDLQLYLIDIVSCPEICPFVVGYSGLGSLTSVSIISCRHTSSSGLSSLLPLVTGPTRSFSSKHKTSNEEAMEDTFGAGTVSISGSCLSIESTHFVVGTGPLFDFGHFAGDSVDLAVECVVSLSASEMVNATSARDSSFSVARRMWLMQRLVGSSVARSTNHFSGTSGIDLNWGADTLVSNCSFSHIVTNTAPAPVTEPPTPESTSGLHFHEFEKEKVSHTGVIFTNKPVWIISSTFKNLEATKHGGAVLLQNNKGSVVIKHSTFTGCKATKDGGAIDAMFNLDHSDAGVHDITIFACDFNANTAGELGGHILVQCFKQTIIAQCTFSDSRSSDTTDPLKQNTALNILFKGPSRIDNCTVSNNEGNTTGGMYVWMLLSDETVDLTNVLFMDNICTFANNKSARITDFGLSHEDGIFTAYDCFSTSALPRSGVLLSDSKSRNITSFLPALVGPSITNIVVEKQVSPAGTGFVVAVKMKGVFTGTTRKYDVTVQSSTGTMIETKGVSFDSTYGTMTIPMSTSLANSLVPSTTYNITKVKKSSTQSARNEFSVGSIPEPDWSWWHHTSDYENGTVFEMSFSTPSGPALTSVSAKLNPSNLNEVILTLYAARVATGNLTLIVSDTSDGANTAITVGNVSFATTPTSSVSTTTTVTVHPSGKLAYGKTYKVKSIKSSLQVLTFGSVLFQVPAAPARLIGATALLDGSKKTFVKLSMEGQELPAGKAFSIVVKEMEGGVVKPDAIPITLSGTIGGSSGLVTSCSASVEICGKTGTVEYGKKYQIVSLTADGQTGVADPTASFIVPVSPCRVEGTGTTKMNGEKTEVSVVLTGVSFSSSTTAVIVKKGLAQISSTSLTVDSDSQMTVVFNAGLSETATVLEYEGEYEIQTVSGLSESFINVGVKFTVPSAPLLLSASPELDTRQNTHFKVLLTGKNLMSGTVWKMKLTDRDEEITVEITTAYKGSSGWVKAGGSNEIEFDKTYTIASLIKSNDASEHIVCNDVSFTTPVGPTLTDIAADLDSTDPNSAILTLTAERTAAGDLTLGVFDTADLQETALSVGVVSFSVSTTTITTTLSVVVHPSGLLAYGKTYKVKTLSSSSISFACSSVSFQIPAAPARLTKASATLVETAKTSVQVSMEGQQLPAGKAFSIIVKEMEGGVVKPDAIPITLSGTIGGSIGLVTSCSVSVEIYGKTDTVEYGKKYQIVSLTADGKTGVADSTASFIVPVSPCRIEGTGTRLLNGGKTEVSIEVIGVSLSSSITAVTVKRGSTVIISKSVSFSSSTQIFVTFGTGVTESTSSLAFDGEYELHGISGLSESFINVGVSFTVPSPPIILSASTELDTNRNTHFKVLLTGKEFISGTVWKMKLTGRNEEIPVEITSATNGESGWMKAGGPNEIEFGKAYTIASLTKSSDTSEHIVCNDVSFTTPAGPTLTGVSADLDPSNLNDAILTLSAERTAVGDLTLIVFDASDTSEKSFTLGTASFTTSTDQVSSTITVVVHQSGKLAYGKTYKVKTLSSSSISFACSSVSFQIPAAPARLTKASATLVETAKTSVQVSMEGQQLPAGKAFSIIVKEMEGDVVIPDATPITFSGPIGGSSGLVTRVLRQLRSMEKQGQLNMGRSIRLCR